MLALHLGPILLFAALSHEIRVVDLRGAPASGVEIRLQNSPQGSTDSSGQLDLDERPNSLSELSIRDERWSQVRCEPTELATR